MYTEDLEEMRITAFRLENPALMDRYADAHEELVAACLAERHLTIDTDRKTRRAAQDRIEAASAKLAKVQSEIQKRMK